MINEYAPLHSGKNPSLHWEETKTGYVLCEHSMRFSGEARMETFICLVGVAALSVGVFLGASPVFAAADTVPSAHWKISSLFLIAGLFLFVFATRGFRKVINVDLSLGQIWYGRLNGFNKSRISHHVPMDRIEKLTTQPCRGPFGYVALSMHLAGRTYPIRILTARSSEIERFRVGLEHDIQRFSTGPSARVSQGRLRSVFQGEGVVVGVT